jgi:hypothetical protein
MNGNEIQIGKKYWIKPDDSSARPALVLRASQTEPRRFQCVGANGQRHVVDADAFVRPIEPEPVMS